MPSPELPLLSFRNADAFEAWLADQPATATGAWVMFGKSGAPEPTLSKSDAIDSALAYGWIDGRLGRVDERYYKVRFTPRTARSAWSQMNRERVERLIADGRMKPGGLAEVTRAKADGRWDAAYAPQGRATPDPGPRGAPSRRNPMRAGFSTVSTPRTAMRCSTASIRRRGRTVAPLRSLKSSRGLLQARPSILSESAAASRRLERSNT